MHFKAFKIHFISPRLDHRCVKFEHSKFNLRSFVHHMWLTKHIVHKIRNKIKNHFTFFKGIVSASSHGLNFTKPSHLTTCPVSTIHNIPTYSCSLLSHLFVLMYVVFFSFLSHSHLWNIIIVTPKCVIRQRERKLTIERKKKVIS